MNNSKYLPARLLIVFALLLVTITTMQPSSVVQAAPTVARGNDDVTAVSNAQTALISGQEPAEQYQFTAGGYALGFQSGGMHVTGGSHALKVDFADANRVAPVAEAAQTFAKVTYPDLWDGSSVTYEPTADGIVKSSYLLSPGADVNRIRLRYDTPVQVDATGQLVFAFETGQMHESAPVAWQDIRGERIPVDVAFRLNSQPDQEVGFQLGAYDPAYPLLIDPTLAWTKMITKTGEDVTGDGVAVDGDGNVYVTGDEGTSGNDNDIYIAKYDKDGTLLWKEELGMTDVRVFGIGLDTSGNVVIGGEDKPARNEKLFVRKFSSVDGSSVCCGSTYSPADFQIFGDAFAINGNDWVMSGSEVDIWGNNERKFIWDGGTTTISNYSYALAVDSSGDIYYGIGYRLYKLRGWTKTFSDTIQGITTDANDNLFVTGAGAFAAKLDSSNGSVLWNTSIGGSPKDIVVDPYGNVYVAAVTGIPENIFITQLDSNGNEQWDYTPGISSLSEVFGGIAVDARAQLYLNGFIMPELFSGDDREAFTAKIPTGPVLGIDKTVEPENPLVGQTVTYQLEFANTREGDRAATDVVITDTFPVSLTNVTVTDSSGVVITPTGTSPNFVWEVGDLAAWGATTGYITLTAQVSATLPTGVYITNTAEIIGTDVLTHVNRTTGTGVAGAIVSIPDLVVTKENDTGGIASVGDTFNWTLTMTNTGTAPADFATGEVILRDELPDGPVWGTPVVTYKDTWDFNMNIDCSITSNVLECTATDTGESFPAPEPRGWLPTHFAYVTVKIPATPQATGVYTNPATTCRVDPDDTIVEADENNNDCNSDTVSVLSPDLVVTKSNNVGGAVAAIGDPWDWTLTITNAGTIAAVFPKDAVLIRDELPGTDIAYDFIVDKDYSGSWSGNGNVQCSSPKYSQDLECTSSSDTPFTFAPGEVLKLTIQNATPSAEVDYVNPRAGGACQVDPDNIITEEGGEDNNDCNSDTVRVTAPDLKVTKSNDVGGRVLLGKPFTWTLSVSNIGSTAVFTDGWTILSDDLPTGSISYGTPVVANVSSVTGGADIQCAINGSTKKLTCTANGGNVTLAGSGRFDVQVTATPTVSGMFTNPRSSYGGYSKCEVDPDDVVAESDENNNDCNSNTVTAVTSNLEVAKSNDAGGKILLGESFDWKLAVSNSGGISVTFAASENILLDKLPDTNISYGAVSVVNATNVTGDANIQCAIDGSYDLTCKANGGDVTVSDSGSFDVQFTATPAVTGDFANPRSGGSCQVDPDNLVAEGDETDNNCNDTVSVTIPDLKVTKSNDGTPVILTNTNDGWTWSLQVGNTGDGYAGFADGDVILRDDLPAGPTWGTPSLSGETEIVGSSRIDCQIVSDVLTCSASGGPVSIAATSGSFTVNFTATPAELGAYTNPVSGGVCTVDPDSAVSEVDENNNACNSNTVVVKAPEIDVLGKGQSITDGDTTPTSANGTDFGSVAMGDPPITHTFTISNTGNADLELGTSSVTLSDGAHFSVTAQPGNSTLTPSNATTFDVSFDPQAAGALTDTVTIANNDSDESQYTFVVSGTGKAPDLQVTKSNDVGGEILLGETFTWTLSISNTGDVEALFAAGETILSDTLPNTDISYGAVSVVNAANVTGDANIQCAIDGSYDLTCTATGGDVTVGIGGSFDVQFTATPAVTGDFTNPRSGGSCQVDPDNLIAEGNENNNDCNSNAVTVTAPNLEVAKSNDADGEILLGETFTWTLSISNTGDVEALFAADETILTDTLPNTNISYGAVSVVNAANVTGDANIQCAINISYNLICEANGGDVTLAGSGSFDVQITATPEVTGDFVNPRSGGSCQVDPDDNITEGDETDNDCNSDTVSVLSPDLSVTKSNNGTPTTLTSTSDGQWIWSLLVNNTGTGYASFAAGKVILHDDLPAGPTWGTPSLSAQAGISGAGSIDCAIASGVLTCSASGGNVSIAATSGSFTVDFTATPAEPGAYTNPVSGGVCAVDPNDTVLEDDDNNNACNSDTVIVQAPEIDVLGNGQSISDGDATPESADGTDFGSAEVSGGVVTHTFTISNTGSGDLNLTGTPNAVSLADGTRFSVTAQPVSTTVGSGQFTTFTVTFDPVGAIGTFTDTVTIANNDADENPYDITISGMSAEPGVTVTPTIANVTEGGATDSYTVVLDSEPTADVTIDISVDNGQASTTPAQLTFTPANWATPQTVTVSAVDDVIDEAPNTATISHTASSSDTRYEGFDVSSVAVNILDNDDPPTLSMAEITFIVDEDAGTATVTVTLDVPSSFTVTVDYETVDGTAISPDDYEAISGTLTIPAGQLTATGQVTIVDDDLDEDDESFSIVLSNPVNAVLPPGKAAPAANQAQVLIRDDDEAPVATPDTYFATTHEILTVPAPGVLDNDTDADTDADQLSAILVTGPLSGTLKLNLDGSFVYTPTVRAYQQDSFIYRVSDGINQSAPALVTINLQQPTAVLVADFSGYQQGRDVELSWQAWGGDLAAFRLLRGGETATPEQAEVIAGSIALRPDGAYRYADRSALAGERYTYWLLALGNDGQETVAASTQITVHAAVRRTFLPAMLN